MRMVINEIKADEKSIILNFDAWLFQDYDDARASLLNKIGDVLYARAKEDEKLLQKVENLYKRIDKLRVLGLLAEGAALAAGIPTFGTITKGIEGARDMATGQGDKTDYDAAAAAIGDAKSKTKGLLRPEEENSPPRQIEAFREELKEILEGLDCTLFVFIDNLDRCLPDKAIHTLEAVRLFLFMERAAFVIAADEDMIRLAVSQHYKADLDRLVTDYLDKLIQIPVRVPQIGVPELRAYLILLLTQQPANSSSPLRDEISKQLTEFFLSRLQTIWKDPFPEAEDIFNALDALSITLDEKTLIEQACQSAKFMAPILVKSRRVSGNPRIVKRMLNTLRMRQNIAGRRGISLSESAMLKLVLFERCADSKATTDLINMIGKSTDGKISLLSQLEKNETISDEALVPESWKKEQEFISEWILLPPALGEIDLRPAAYLSRETQPSFSPSGSLSVQAQRAVAVLINATREAAQSTKDALAALENEDIPPAMDELLKKLSEATSWKKKPEGWSGAVALAGKNEEAAKSLATFIRSRNLQPIPPWMATTLNKKNWWSE